MKEKYLAFFLLFFSCSALFAQSRQEQEQEKPDPMPIWINWDYNCNALDSAGIAAFVEEAARTGMKGVNLRISNKGALNYPTRVGEPYRERLDAFGPGYDPLRILIRECKRQGIGSCVWFDLYEAVYDTLITARPDLTPQGLPGKPDYAGSYCYAEPEVRQHVLSIVKELAGYGPDRIFFCTKSSHIPTGTQLTRNRDSGFNPPAIARYRELYGDDLPPERFDREKLSRIHGEYLIDFLVEARDILHTAGIESVVGATVSGKLQIGGNILLDWRRVIERRAADALCMANSRGEYKIFYTPEGQHVFREIAAACRRAEMRFYPYIISSGTHSVIAKEFGMRALLDYVPRQIRYLQALGGEELIIHDLDLFSLDPVVRRRLWEAAGLNRLPVLPGSRERLSIPEPGETSSSGGNAKPPRASSGSDGVQDADQPGIAGSPAQSAGEPFKSPPHAAVPNGNFESRRDSPEGPQPAGWEPVATGGLSAGYDWKVLHGDPTSGRNFDGRSSLLLSADAPASGVTGSVAGSRQGMAHRMAAWKTVIQVPEGAASGAQMIRSMVHGEGMSAIKAAGVKIRWYDGNGRLLDTLDVPAPSTGAFPWQAIETSFTLDARARSGEILLYLLAGENGRAAGRLWFDRLELVPPETGLREQTAE